VRARLGLVCNWICANRDAGRRFDRSSLLADMRLFLERLRYMPKSDLMRFEEKFQGTDSYK